MASIRDVLEKLLQAPSLADDAGTPTIQALINEMEDTIDVEGQLLFEDGTAAAPALAFSGDNNVGLYRHAVDTLGITTGGVLRIRVQDSDTRFLHPVHLPSGTAAAPSLTFTADTDVGLFLSGNQLAVSIAGTQRLSFTSAGILMAEGNNIATGSTTGTKIAASATQKIAFYGATPVTQQTGVAETTAAIHAALVNLGLITA